MELTIYQIDAFAANPLEGNPAAVCPLQEWLPEKLMQSIANENNLSETAFFVPTEDGYEIRWFTPRHEVKLCGHATLASAYVIFTFLEPERTQITFDSKSGPLGVVLQEDGWIEMDFPAQPPEPCPLPEEIRGAFKHIPTDCLKSEDYIVVFRNELQVAEAEPNLFLLNELDLRGVAITAIGEDYDFVARFFAPKQGINEDPVTGSAYTQLVPYWSKVLDKEQLDARQLSQRGGEVRCVLDGDRVKISGQAVKFMVGTITIP